MIAQPVLPDPPGLGSLTPTEERNWSMAAHFGAVVAAAVAMGFLAPLGVLLFMGNRSEFVRRHATESLNFQLTLLVYLALALGATLVTFGLGLLVLIPVAALVAVLALIVIIFATMAASRGENFSYPLTFHFIR